MKQKFHHSPFTIHHSAQQGFTLIELLLYIVIVSIILAAVIPFAWNVIEGGVKSSVQQEIYATTRYMSERLKYEIRNVTNINTASSNFDVNLATTANTKLSLTQTAPNNPTLFDVTSGNLRITQGSNAAVNLNSANTQITNLTFTNYSSTDNKTKHIGFTLTVATRYNSGRQEYQATQSITGSAELRSN